MPVAIERDVIGRWATWAVADLSSGPETDCRVIVPLLMSRVKRLPAAESRASPLRNCLGRSALFAFLAWPCFLTLGSSMGSSSLVRVSVSPFTVNV